MLPNKNNDQIVTTAQDIHAFMFKSLIEAYLKGKGYTMDEVKKLPEGEAKRLMTEASTYASSKMAEVEIRAHYMQELHDAYTTLE